MIEPGKSKANIGADITLLGIACHYVPVLPLYVWLLTIEVNCLICLVFIEGQFWSFSFDIKSSNTRKKRDRKVFKSSFNSTYRRHLLALKRHNVCWRRQWGAIAARTDGIRSRARFGAGKRASFSSVYAHGQSPRTKHQSANILEKRSNEICLETSVWLAFSHAC